MSFEDRVRVAAGEPPAGVDADDWCDMVIAATLGVVEADAADNDGTPEEYAVAALRSAVPVVIAAITGALADTFADAAGAARAYHYKAAMNRAARIARAYGGDQ